jgi:hypothetical protein
MARPIDVFMYDVRVENASGDVEGDSAVRVVRCDGRDWNDVWKPTLTISQPNCRCYSNAMLR